MPNPGGCRDDDRIRLQPVEFLGNRHGDVGRGGQDYNIWLIFNDLTSRGEQLEVEVVRQPADPGIGGVKAADLISTAASKSLNDSAAHAADTYNCNFHISFLLVYKS